MKRFVYWASVILLSGMMIALFPLCSALGQKTETGGSFLLVTGSPTQIIYSYHGSNTKTLLISLESFGNGTLRLARWTGISWRRQGEPMVGQGVWTYEIPISRGTKLQLIGSDFTDSMAGTVAITFPSDVTLPARASWIVPPIATLPLSPSGETARFVLVENSTDSQGPIDVMFDNTRIGGVKPGNFRIFDDIVCSGIAIKPEVDETATGTYLVK